MISLDAVARYWHCVCEIRRSLEVSKVYYRCLLASTGGTRRPPLPLIDREELHSIYCEFSRKKGARSMLGGLLPASCHIVMLLIVIHIIYHIQSY